MEGKLIRLGIMVYALCMGMLAAGGIRAAEGKPKSETPDLVGGKAIFVKFCAGCHGRDGRGDGYRMLGPTPADLTAIESKQKSDATLLKTIHDGKPNMPVWKYKLSINEARDVLAYIRTLQERP
jgi:mono/diheme cytochrome c family protein